MQPGWQSVGSLGSGGRTVNLITALWPRLGRVLLPSTCLVCGAAGDAALDLCRACADALPWNTAACALCALPLPLAAPACGACLVAPPPYDSCHAALRYADPVDRLLPRFKFRAGLAAGRLLAGWLLQRWSQPPAPVDLLLPLPLHRQRLGRRGYNQALELARPLARAWQVPLAPAALQRVRATLAQSDLDAAARRRNVRNAFGADTGPLRGQRVLLIDDVITTGATVAAAATALREAGAAQVHVLALARAPMPGRG